MSMRALIPFAAIGLLAGCADAAEQPQPAEVEAADYEAEVVEIDAQALAARIEAGDVRLIDVRTPEEFAEGHIDGAINVPVDDFDPVTLPEADDKETILYCRSSGRSGRAATMLSEAREAPATHLEGGILAWEEAGLPVVKPE